MPVTSNETESSGMPLLLHSPKCISKRQGCKDAVKITGYNYVHTPIMNTIYFPRTGAMDSFKALLIEDRDGKVVNGLSA